MIDSAPSSTTLPKLSFNEKLAYGLGDVGNALAVSSISFWLLIYLTDVAGLGAFLAGIAMMIGRAWDALADPVVGWITDNTNTRWGKRRPFLLFGAIPYAFCYSLLWMVPAFQSELGVFIYITIVLLMFNTCFAFVIVPYASLTASITNDYSERLSLTAFRMVASQSSFLIGAAVPSALVLWITSPDGGEAFFIRTGLQGIVDGIFGSWAHTPRQGYAMMAALFSMIMVASVWTVFTGIRERIVEGAAHPHHNGSPFSYGFAIIKQLKTNRPFRLGVSILCLSECAAALVAVNLPYYIQYVLLLEAKRTSILVTLFLGAIAGVPIWSAIGRRFGKSETYRIVVLVYAGLLCLLPFLPSGNPTPIFIFAALGGVCHAAALMIPWSIIPDVVEYDELHSGMRREGLFYGGSLFSYKLATAIGVMLSGGILTLIGYIPNEAQSADTIFGMKATISLAPAAFLILASFIASKYPLTATRHKEILDALKQRTDAGV